MVKLIKLSYAFQETKSSKFYSIRITQIIQMVEDTYDLSIYDKQISALILIQCWDIKDCLQDTV